MRSLREESGQALAVVVLSLTMLLGFVGLAVDMGSLLHNKRELQVAADAAAVAGAMHANYPDLVAAAKNASAANGFTDGSNNVTVTINTPPTAGNYASQTGYVEAIVQQNEPTIFMGLFKHGTMPVLARAVAVNKSSVNGGCIYTLGATGSDFTVSGSAQIQSTQCGLIIDSNSKTALSMSGSATLDFASIGIVGNYSQSGSGSISPTPSTGIIPYSDPLSFIPQYTCSTNSCTSDGGITNVSCSSQLKVSGSKATTLSPGCYKGLSISGSGNITLNPGIYIFNGAASVSGSVTLTGTGVTIYMAAGDLSISGSVTSNLSAPTSGAFNGILFAQSPSDNSTASISGSASSNLQGIIYFPAAELDLSGSNGSKIYTDFVVNSLKISGSVSFNDYASLSGVNSPLTSVSLVE